MSDALWRVALREGPRLARGPVEDGPREVIGSGVTLADLLSRGGPLLDDLPDEGPLPADVRVIAPVDVQPVWASGVTFERSRSARMAESEESADIYDRVYDAERPELFLKAMPGESRGSGEHITVRADSTWDVPEPELGIVADARGRAAGYVLGNDVSSRSIEGENPLYLPQAKVWEGSCSLGPCIVPIEHAPALDEMTISLVVRRGDDVSFSDTVELKRMRRGVDDLLSWLYRAKRFPYGTVLLTGTSIVPDDSFTLQADDEVEIATPGLGSLVNTVRSLDAGLSG